VYVTDGDFHFGTVTEAARMMTHIGEIRPTYVIGIGYAAERGDYEYANARRCLDLFVPPRRSVEVSPFGTTMEFGGADVFLRALREHVLPDVELRYARIEPTQRYLFGTSAGGQFAAHVLSQAPQLFVGYAMMSPALQGWPMVRGARPVLDTIASLPMDGIPRGTRVFLSAGEYEDDPGAPFADAALLGNLYPLRAELATRGVQTRLTVLPGETHTSVYGAAISRALRYLLATS